MSKKDVVVEVENVHKYYFLGGETIKALDGINLVVYRGEYLSVMGPSGSGKTTLFNMIGALDMPTKGTVKLEGRDLRKLKPKELAWIRCHKVGYIFQTFNLIPVLTALDNVALPMVFAGVSRKERIKRAMELLKMVGLEGREKHRPSELSGGQQQRVAIARALANKPSLILADEPTGNLDLTTGLKIINILKNLTIERNVTVITNTHDLKMIDVSDRVVWLRDGKKVDEKSREELSIEVGAIEGVEGYEI